MYFAFHIESKKKQTFFETLLVNYSIKKCSAVLSSVNFLTNRLK